MTTIIDLYRLLFGRSGTTKASDVDVAEHGRVGGVSTEQPFKFVDLPNYAFKVTEDGDYTYIALAPPGTDQSAEAWKAMRVDSSVEGDTVITYADGDTDFDNVATDLTALSYS